MMVNFCYISYRWNQKSLIALRASGLVSPMWQKLEPLKLIMQIIQRDKPQCEFPKEIIIMQLQANWNREYIFRGAHEFTQSLWKQKVS